MASQHVDVLIVGGGLTGAALLLALEGKGLSTLLVEAHPLEKLVKKDFDARSLALSESSVRILKQLAIWPLLLPEANPIQAIHISEQGRFGRVCLNHPEPLGFVVELQTVSRALYEKLPKSQVLAGAKLTALDSQLGRAEIQQGDKTLSIDAKIIVAADGADSMVRRLAGLSQETKAYNQEALVANIGLSRSHANQAYERFTSHGPLAMLPMKDQRASLVWAMRPNEAKQTLALSDKDFLKRLQQAFGYRLGRLDKVGKRVLFPLRQVLMKKPCAWPLVFIGNAAHSLHPVAGQGFNLGLRDAAALAQCLLQYGLGKEALQQYQHMRKYDQKSIIQFTDTLAQAFTSKLPGLRVLRSLGLLAVDMLPGLQKLLKHHAGGFSGIVPDLVCGIDLEQLNATNI